jgi:hypothetical protein
MSSSDPDKRDVGAVDEELAKRDGPLDFGNGWSEFYNRQMAAKRDLILVDNEQELGKRDAEPLISSSWMDRGGIPEYYPPGVKYAARDIEPKRPSWADNVKVTIPEYYPPDLKHAERDADPQSSNWGPPPGPNHAKRDAEPQRPSWMDRVMIPESYPPGVKYAARDAEPQRPSWMDRVMIPGYYPGPNNAKRDAEPVRLAELPGGPPRSDMSAYLNNYKPSKSILLNERDAEPVMQFVTSGPPGLEFKSWPASEYKSWPGSKGLSERDLLLVDGDEQEDLGKREDDPAPKTGLQKLVDKFYASRGIANKRDLYLAKREEETDPQKLIDKFYASRIAYKRDLLLVDGDEQEDLAKRAEKTALEKLVDKFYESRGIANKRDLLLVDGDEQEDLSKRQEKTGLQKLVDKFYASRGIANKRDLLLVDGDEQEDLGKREESDVQKIIDELYGSRVVGNKRDLLLVDGSQEGLGKREDEPAPKTGLQKLVDKFYASRGIANKREAEPEAEPYSTVSVDSKSFQPLPPDFTRIGVSVPRGGFKKPGSVKLLERDVFLVGDDE